MESRNPAADRAEQPSHLAFRRVMHRGHLLAVRARYTKGDFGTSEAYVAETYGKTPSFLCVLQLHDFPATDAWRDGQHLRQPLLAGGRSHVLDLRHAWRTDVRNPFDNVHVNVRQETIDELAEEAGLSRIEIAPEQSFESKDDEVVRGLAMALIPALRRPCEMSGLFADSIVRAMAVHLAQSYGGLGAIDRRGTRGLAPWQERKARDLLLGHMDADIDLATLAGACGLSPGYFAKAFKRTTGMPPHRWLLRQRIDRACDMLLHTDHAIGVIALNCGFADQSHMTRVFARAMGTTPGAWRRIRRS